MAQEMNFNGVELSVVMPLLYGDAYQHTVPHQIAQGPLHDLGPNSLVQAGM
jgi:hypothetical protein